jgi:hypothetical protein
MKSRLVFLAPSEKMEQKICFFFNRNLTANLTFFDDFWTKFLYAQMEERKINKIQSWRKGSQKIDDKEIFFLKSIQLINFQQIFDDIEMYLNNLNLIKQCYCTELILNSESQIIFLLIVECSHGGLISNSWQFQQYRFHVFDLNHE